MAENLELALLTQAELWERMAVLREKIDKTPTRAGLRYEILQERLKAQLNRMSEFCPHELIREKRPSFNKKTLGANGRWNIHYTLETIVCQHCRREGFDMNDYALKGVGLHVE